MGRIWHERWEESGMKPGSEPRTNRKCNLKGAWGDSSKNWEIFMMDLEHGRGKKPGAKKILSHWASFE